MFNLQKFMKNHSCANFCPVESSAEHLNCVALHDKNRKLQNHIKSLKNNIKKGLGEVEMENCEG